MNESVTESRLDRFIVHGAYNQQVCSAIGVVLNLIVPVVFVREIERV